MKHDCQSEGEKEQMLIIWVSDNQIYSSWNERIDEAGVIFDSPWGGEDVDGWNKQGSYQ